MNKGLTRKQFMTEVSRYPGVSLDLESENDGDTLILDSAAGKIFAANDCHCLVEQYRNWGGQSWKPEAYKLMTERLSYGLRECNDPECDTCHPVDEVENG
jgi:hypothetical protein